MSGFESPEGGALGGVADGDAPADVVDQPGWPSATGYAATSPYPAYPPTAPGLLYPGGLGGPAGPVDSDFAGNQPPPPGFAQAYPYQAAYPYLPGYGPQAGTNGLSIAALICGICGFLYGVPAVLGIIFGCVSLSQIRRTGQSGRGMAIAGLVCGIAWIVLFIILIIVVITAVNSLQATN